MAEIIKVFRENIPTMRFIGKKYDNFGHWGEWWQNGWFDLLEQTIQTVRQEVLMDSAISSTNKNKEIIFRLYQQGIFNIKDSVVWVSESLGISKNTVYLHLRNLKQELPM